MSELQIFGNEEFGEVRAVVIDDQPMFCLADVCKALEIKNVSDCKSRLNQKGIVITDTLTKGGKQKLLYVNESNLYKVIFQSRKESAERFTDWVTSEVLPSIRKTGSYSRMTPEQMMRVQLGMIDSHEERITHLENHMVIDYGQQNVLANKVAEIVVSCLGGKSMPAYKELSKKVFSECNRDIKNYFNVNSRNNIPKSKFDDALDYINAWKPCTNTVMAIRDCNAQVRIEF